MQEGEEENLSWIKLIIFQSSKMKDIPSIKSLNFLKTFNLSTKTSGTLIRQIKCQISLGKRHRHPKYGNLYITTKVC